MGIRHDVVLAAVDDQNRSLHLGKAREVVIPKPADEAHRQEPVHLCAEIGCGSKRGVHDERARRRAGGKPGSNGAAQRFAEQHDIAGRNAAARLLGQPLRVPPRTTALGALAHYVSHANPRHYQPTNITFGIMEAIDDRKMPRMRGADGRRLSRKDTRKLALSERALADLERWMDTSAQTLHTDSPVSSR